VNLILLNEDGRLPATPFFVKFDHQLIILIVWVLSSAISLPAIAWWRLTASGPAPALKCLFTTNLGYLVFSSTVSFYLPLMVMVFTYWRVYQAARAYSKSIASGVKQVGGNFALRIHRGGIGSPTTLYSGKRRGLSSQISRWVTIMLI